MQLVFEPPLRKLDLGDFLRWPSGPLERFQVVLILFAFEIVRAEVLRFFFIH